MTRKDYELIARVFADTRPLSPFKPEADQWRTTAELMADRLAVTNPLFDRNKIIDTCEE
jgi:hypothetical protein